MMPLMLKSPTLPLKLDPGGLRIQACKEDDETGRTTLLAFTVIREILGINLLGLIYSTAVKFLIRIGTYNVTNSILYIYIQQCKT